MTYSELIEGAYLEIAKKAIMELSQLTLPDMGDFPNGEEPA